MTALGCGFAGAVLCRPKKRTSQCVLPASLGPFWVIDVNVQGLDE